MPSSTRDSPSNKLDLNSKLTKKVTRSRRSKPVNGTHLDFEQDGEVVVYQPPDVFDSSYQPSTILQRSEILRRPLANQGSRRNPLRMDTQDGPWSISVAESHQDSPTYSIYIKSQSPDYLLLTPPKQHVAPTLHLTLTRTAAEISSLHSKLKDSYPTLQLPPLPLDSSVTGSPGKRKHSFLSTLSRFASPGPKPRMPSSHSHVHQEIGDDPFLASPQTVTTSLASYLTALSNDQIVRVSKAWRRFVQVRTDDLESVRVERAIKRVRSDLAKHTSSPVTTHPPPLPILSNATSIMVSESQSRIVEPTEGEGSQPTVVTADMKRAESPTRGDGSEQIVAAYIPEANIPLPEETSLLDDEDTAAAVAMVTVTPESTPASTSAFKPESLEAERTSEPSEPAEPGSKGDSTVSLSDSLEQLSKPNQVIHRLARSASADPDKATRLSRVYKSSALESLVSTTDDESVAQSDGIRSNGISKRSKRKVVIDDFEMLRVLGKGCAGKVLLVRHKATEETYALKAITKRHVLAHQELQHTLTEQAVLKRMAKDGADPFVVKLWWSFHDKENLFLVMDFHPGGDLATQLARWGRLGRDRARFYAAEIVEGVEGLHAAGVIYRDLKPENILIGVDGHIVLTDFGLSKEFPRQNSHLLAPPTAPATPSGSNSKTEYYSTEDVAAPTPYWMKGEDGNVSWRSPQSTDTTSTFCGTAEYLAPEVIQGLAYSYEVDWWSFGTMLYEMLSGIVSFASGTEFFFYVS
jgi:serum/glucocorticoid-regulated kinase 2